MVVCNTSSGLVKYLNTRRTFYRAHTDFALSDDDSMALNLVFSNLIIIGVNELITQILSSAEVSF